MSSDISAEDKEFLAACEEEFKNRYTENDEKFMKVFKSEPSKPPIMESWWVSQSFGRRNDRRNRRPYDRPNQGQGDQRRGYNDYHHRNRGEGYHNHRPRHY